MKQKLCGFIQKFYNIGVLESDSDAIKIGKKFYNTIILYSLIISILLPFFLLLFVKRFAFLLAYSLLLITILGFQLYFNSRNKFQLSVNFSLISVSITTLIFYAVLLHKDWSVTFSLFYAIKLFMILLVTLGIFLRNMLKINTLPSIIVIMILFYAMDIPVIKTNTQSLTLNPVDILYFDLLISLLLFFYLVFNRHFIKLKASYEHTIEAQKQDLEESYNLLNNKTLTLTQNLQKASRFYNLMLQTPADLDNFFKKYFIIYKPVMYLSGDFYYFKIQDDKIYIILADSIGHGISAAIVNIFALALLEFRAKEFSDPATLLGEMKCMFDSYKPIPFEVDASFDIAIVLFDKTTKQLTYSSAAMPIYAVKNGELIKLNYYHSPISQYSKVKEFENWTIKLNPGDKFYLYTDGVVDLFKMLGRELLGINSFKELITSISKRDLETQQRYMNILINKAIKQPIPIDDITIMGFEVE